MSELFASTPVDYLDAVDHAVGFEVQQILRDAYYRPRQRAQLAVDLIRFHVTRTAPVVEAAEYERKSDA